MLLWILPDTLMTGYNLLARVGELAEFWKKNDAFLSIFFCWILQFIMDGNWFPFYLLWRNSWYNDYRNWLTAPQAGRSSGKSTNAFGLCLNGEILWVDTRQDPIRIIYIWAKVHILFLTVNITKSQWHKTKFGRSIVEKRAVFISGLILTHLKPQ